MRRRNVFLSALAVLAAGRVFAAPSETERARIERLIAFVETQKSVQFMRNGTAYPGPDAARFLRGKMDKMGEHVSTAQQFIEQIASKSSTTGQPYMMRLADGRIVPAEVVLAEELARMDAKP
jgi:Family of unknown function (DUF5329)